MAKAMASTIARQGRPLTVPSIVNTSSRPRARVAATVSALKRGLPTGPPDVSHAEPAGPTFVAQAFPAPVVPGAAGLESSFGGEVPSLRHVLQLADRLAEVREPAGPKTIRAMARPGSGASAARGLRHDVLLGRPLESGQGDSVLSMPSRGWRTIRPVGRSLRLSPLPRRYAMAQHQASWIDKIYQNIRYLVEWSHLDSNQGPPACEAESAGLTA